MLEAYLPEVVITHALRSPIGKFMGSFSPLTAVELGTAVVKKLLDESGVAHDEIDEVLMGQARQLGSGPNPARQVTIRSGISESTPAMTLNKACGSGLMAIWSAYRNIALGEAKLIIAGGMESMTNMPFLLPKMRMGYRLGHDRVLDGSYQDGFTCPLVGGPMGETAENLADKYAISREEQDRYALRSFHRWQAAQEKGLFADERIEVLVPARSGKVTPMNTDEHGRLDLTMEKLGKLKPVFRTENGTVHAGNSSGITDGAAALLVMTKEEAVRRDFPILARLGKAKTAGVDPKVMGIGPVPAIQELCRAEGRKLDDFDLIELNEAFAAQVIACDRELGLDADKLNVNGGAIALGHPIGATGARIVVTLLHEMKRRNAELGMATLCMSGGMGMAVSFHAG